MFQFPEFALMHLCIQCIVAGITGSGFPIRTSSVQSLCSNSPKLFAATNVLHRLLVPRHPPYTLSSLALFFPKAPTSFTTLRSARRSVNLDTTLKKRGSILNTQISIYLSHSIVKEQNTESAWPKPNAVGSLKSKLSSAIKHGLSYTFVSPSDSSKTIDGLTRGSFFDQRRTLTSKHAP